MSATVFCTKIVRKNRHIHGIVSNNIILFVGNLLVEAPDEFFIIDHISIYLSIYNDMMVFDGYAYTICYYYNIGKQYISGRIVATNIHRIERYIHL